MRDAVQPLDRAALEAYALAIAFGVAFISAIALTVRSSKEAGMKLETTDGNEIVPTSAEEAQQPAKFTFDLELPDGSLLRVVGTTKADARLARDELVAGAAQLIDRMVDAGWFPGGLRQVQPTVVNGDPFTMQLRLCDDDGMADLTTLAHLRRVGEHEPYTGPAFRCTGHAHLAGEHIRCTSPAHHEQPPALEAGGAVPHVTQATVPAGTQISTSPNSRS